MTFDQLELIPQILSAVKSTGYTVPTPIQAQTIPFILDGKDIFGSAQTGTGKTAAFSLPILQLIHNKSQKTRGIKALILAPTRELAVQIGDSFRKYGKNLKVFSAVVFGGVSQKPQADALRRGVDILVATPGRLLDLINQKIVKLDKVEYLVLDEADRMLDMGFITDIKKIIPLIPKERQTIFFSATAPYEIKKLAQTLLNDPVHVDIPSEYNVADIKKTLYYVEKSEKIKLLEHLINEQNISHALIFTRTKIKAERLAKDLKHSGIPTDAIHGDKSQQARQRALNNFKKNSIEILVATDVASRGIDVKSLPYVINYDMPESVDTFTHRVGRTGRAGKSGTAISFCSGDEKKLAKPVLRLFPEISVEEHPYKKPGHFAKPEKDFRSHSKRSDYKRSKKSFGKKEKRRKWSR